MARPYLPHLLTQLQQTLDLLHSEKLLTASDLSLIKSRLPSSSGQVAPPRATDAALAGEMNSLVLSSVPDPKEIVVAEWDYRSEQPEDISFAAGDRIDLIEESSPEWWLGSFNGKTGIFPSAYVRKQNHGPSAPPRVSPSPSPSYASQPGPSYQPPQQQWPPQNAPYPQHNAPYQPYYQQGPPQPYYGGAPPGQQMQPYYDSKPEYNSTPPPQQQMQQAPPPAVPEKKPSKLSGYGKIIATSAAGGLGFGAGSALGSDLIHKIF